MAYIKKLDSIDILETIEKFHNDWGKVPYVGFLAGYHKVSKRLIYNKLSILEKAGKIKRIKKNVNFTDYILLK
jgi:hypothetical protein